MDQHDPLLTEKPAGLLSRPITSLATIIFAPFAVLLGIVTPKIGFDLEAWRILLGVWLVFLNVFIGFAALAWGALRIIRQHPLGDRGYADWLEHSPWAPGQPLPRGPIRLQWQDGVVALVLTAIAGLTVLATPVPLAVVVAPALLMLLGAGAACHLGNAQTEQQRYAYLAIGSAAAIGFVAPLWVCVAAIPMVVYAIGRAGVRRAMLAFPWPRSPEPPRALGWPYSVLLNEPRDAKTTVSVAALRGVLVFAVVLSFFGHVTAGPKDLDDLPMIATLGCGLFSFALMLYRFQAYAPVICPTLCWGERTGLGRWIVPRHDVIFAVLLAIASSGPVITYTLATWLAPHAHFAAAVGSGVAVFLTYGLGPAVSELHFTGRHTIVARHGKSGDVNYKHYVHVHA